jgi:predicted enzyme related to lactoylglutathione lyase
MARVVGVGGIFFRCRDPAALAGWYARHLGMPIADFGGVAFRPGDAPKGAMCVWSPLPESTKYFEPAAKEFMINLMVDDLERALSQVAEGGATIVGAIEQLDYGRFGWFVDPEGNKVELWQPHEAAAAQPSPN